MYICVLKTYISIHAFFILKFITSCQKSQINSWEGHYSQMCNQGTLQSSQPTSNVYSPPLDCTCAIKEHYSPPSQ